MKKNILLTLSAFAMILPLVGCKSQTVDWSAKQANFERVEEEQRKSRLEGYKAVKAILDVYVSHLPGKLEGMVSKNFVPNKQEFISHVEHSALDKTVTNIEVIVDTAAFVQGVFAVTYDWNRTYRTNASGAYAKDSGKTSFVFVKEPDGWRLLQVTGADIF